MSLHLYTWTVVLLHVKRSADDDESCCCRSLRVARVDPPYRKGDRILWRDLCLVLLFLRLYAFASTAWMFVTLIPHSYACMRTSMHSNGHTTGSRKAAPAVHTESAPHAIHPTTQYTTTTYINNSNASFFFFFANFFFSIALYIAATLLHKLLFSLFSWASDYYSSWRKKKRRKWKK